jgi:hypothetical protein
MAASRAIPRGDRGPRAAARPPQRWRALLGPWGGLVLAAAALFVVGVLVLPTALPPVRTAWVTTTPPYTDPPPLAGGLCDPVTTPTPSSLLIPIAPPGQALGAGGSLGFAYEVAIVGYTSADDGMTLYFPTVTALFPEPNGTTPGLVVPAQSLVVRAPGWSNPATTSRSLVFPAGVQFDASQPPFLTTAKLAVMATAPYGTLTLQVRWHWVLAPPGQPAQNGSWSVVTPSASWPTQLPTEFYPAPYAALLASTGSTATIGANYSAELGGLVAGRYLFLELEDPGTGKVLQSQGTTGTAHAATVNVSIPMLDYDRSLAPGTYLVHVHDSCGALLYSNSVSAHFAPSANVAFGFSPTSCGPITIDGQSYTNAGVGVLVPSTSAYPFTLAACSGHTFAGWNMTGGVQIAGANALLVSASGTFVVNYH